MKPLREDEQMAFKGRPWQHWLSMEPLALHDFDVAALASRPWWWNIECRSSPHTLPDVSLCNQNQTLRASQGLPMGSMCLRATSRGRAFWLELLTCAASICLHSVRKSVQSWPSSDSAHEEMDTIWELGLCCKFCESQPSGESLLWCHHQAGCLHKALPCKVTRLPPGSVGRLAESSWRYQTHWAG